METDIKRAEKYCLRLLAARARTEKEVSGRLEAKGFSGVCRVKVLKKLIDNKLIDDAVFASDWIESRIKYKPRSRALIKRELLEKGIKKEIVEQAISGVGEILNDRNMSARIVERQLPELDGLDGEKKKEKLFRTLLMRGFDMETAEEAVNSVIKDR
jgi:regulatory protein